MNIKKLTEMEGQKVFAAYNDKERYIACGEPLFGQGPATITLYNEYGQGSYVAYLQIIQKVGVKEVEYRVPASRYKLHLYPEEIRE